MNDLASAWDERVERGLRTLPGGVSARIAWLREPRRRLVRLGAGVLLVAGGMLSILPILGLWMLPLGLALIAEDVPGLKRPLERAARGCERVVARIGRKRAPASWPTPSPRLDGEKSSQAGPNRACPIGADIT